MTSPLVRSSTVVGGEPQPTICAVTRRSVIRRAMATSLAFGGLSALARVVGVSEHNARALGHPLRDPKSILDLPREFTYRVVSVTGEVMNDGLLVPARPDGMGAFEDDRGHIVLMRNHELRSDDPSLGPWGPDNDLLTASYARCAYGSPRHNESRGSIPKGCVTRVVLDPRSLDVERQVLAMGGMSRNCAGGVTPWGTWLTCEEDTDPHATDDELRHGFVFEVEATTNTGIQVASPITHMGRFRHEAAGVHRPSGCVFMTEDMRDGLFYRYVPSHPGALRRGGELCALALAPTDTRRRAMLRGIAAPTRWIPLRDVTAPKNDLRLRGRAAGAFPFVRGEGVWIGTDGIYFACTEGGTRGLGQVWRYEPSPYEGTETESKRPGLLRLIYECRSVDAPAMCDNITVAPWGDLLICEDRSRSRVGTARTNAIWGLTPRGESYRFAVNRLDTSEFSGACFSPDGATLFLNLHQAGLTLAIRGPWPKGPA